AALVLTRGGVGPLDGPETVGPDHGDLVVDGLGDRDRGVDQSLEFGADPRAVDEVAQCVAPGDPLAAEGEGERGVLAQVVRERAGGARGRGESRLVRAGRQVAVVDRHVKGSLKHGQGHRQSDSAGAAMARDCHTNLRSTSPMRRRPGRGRPSGTGVSREARHNPDMMQPSYPQVRTTSGLVGTPLSNRYLKL